MQITIDVRPEVAAFAVLMERNLRRNDHKDGWHGCKPLWLIAKLGEEYGELCRQAACDTSWPNVVASEAADVANMAMMVADESYGLMDTLQEMGLMKVLANSRQALAQGGK